MSTITAILEPNADGSLHLPLPPELRSGRIKVEATLELVEPPLQSAEHKQRELLELMNRIAARNPFRAIADPVAWQREGREDRPMPFRE